MNGAARSVQRAGPPSMLKSMRSTATGDVTSQAIAPETVSAVGETKVRAASTGGGGGGEGEGEGQASVAVTTHAVAELFPPLTASTPSR